MLLMAFVVLVVERAYRATGPVVGNRLRHFLAAMRIAAMGVVLFMLSGATLLLEQTAPAPLSFLVDDSSSMALPSALEMDETLNRYEMIRTKLPAVEVEGPIRVVLPSRGIAFDVESPDEAAARLAEFSPIGAETRLGDWVAHALTEAAVPPRAIVLFSDGVNTSGPGLAEAAEAARRRKVPLFCVGPDGLAVVPRLALSNLAAPRNVFPDDPVVFQFTLETAGLEGKEIRIRLDQEGASEPVDARTLKISRDGSQTGLLAARPEETGRIAYTITASVEGNATIPPARLVHAVEVRSDPIRVLLAAEVPGFEFRFLRNLLLREDSVAARVWLKTADPLWVRQNPDALAEFPKDRAALAEYDVIVLADVSAESLPVESIPHPAAAGGSRRPTSLVFVAGTAETLESYRGTALEALVPIRFDDLREAGPFVSVDGIPVAATPLGLAFGPMQLGDTPAASRTAWDSLPPIYGFVASPEVRPGAAVLLTTSGPSGDQEERPPLIVTWTVGAGRVWLQTTDESWRWRAGNDEQFYTRYWLQTLRYLTQGDEGETERATQDRTPSETSSAEEAVKVQDTTALIEAAALAGGRFVPLDRLETLSDSVPPPRRAVVATSAPVPLWNAWYTLTLLFALLSAEWMLRRYYRLV